MYLANARTGFVGVIDLKTFKLVRSASLGTQASALAAPRPLALSADGATMYLARPAGIVPIAADTLAAGTPLATRAFGSLALGTDGSTLYASGGGSTMTLDTRTGAAGATLTTSGGLTLVGVARP